MNDKQETAKFILSIDVDDLLVANADLFQQSLPAGYRSALAAEVLATLDLLESCQRTATFFVNAQYCSEFHEVVREIVLRGHPIASHGFKHFHAGTTTFSEFRDDLLRSLDALREFQQSIIGYRPPAFTMPYRDEYFEILVDNGIRYLSSGAGFRRSNVPETNRPLQLTPELMHVPISTRYVVPGVKYPVGYGIVARLLPESLYLYTMQKWSKRVDFVHFYCHSFEVSGLRAEIPSTFSARAALATRIYLLRCQNRQELFRRVFRAAPFQSIEQALFAG